MKKNQKTALIVAMTAITGATLAQETDAMRAAIADMQAEYGKDSIHVEYTWNPFDGMLA